MNLSCRKFITGVLSSILLTSSGYAAGVGNNAGVALYGISSARASALGNAFTAVNDDITALEFNPGSLASLESGQVSLQHQSGIAGDSFDKALAGLNLLGGSVGASVGRYDSGKANLFDGTTQRSLTAEQDWTGTLGYGRNFGKMGTGLSARYLSSKLAESYSGTAASLEAGVQYPIFKQLRLGLSGPIVQSKLKVGDASESLPKIYRLGFASNLNMDLATGKLPINLLLDVPYSVDERQAWAAVGAETRFGPLSLRAGYNSGSDANHFSFGAGFVFSQFSLDYSYGLVESGFNAINRVSFSMKFGQNSASKPGSEVQNHGHDVYVLDQIHDPQAFAAGTKVVSETK